ncbi:hypothetical protein DT73_02685 [Mangrovibacter sp. MFB070]|uniref:GGDEF domain-containing protein n=1 Tax=Mangrovibacter sp. MFB070 TaxID=1224318 RepID=UPI0004D87BBD|nr:GGDEF domain-containing protein [Mangrovibacter sp. MFB070]KEA54296.1 hypothetical protein DT73_02685 [Mangrovibacter sp. MFB070]
MTAFDAVTLASIFNNIICSLIGCFFLFQVSRNQSGHKKKAATYFFLCFFFLGSAFTLMMIRVWLPIVFSIIMANGLYVTTAYMMLFGFLSWFRIPVRGIHILIMMINITVIITAMLFFYLHYRSFITRVYIGGINNATLFFLCFAVCWRHRSQCGKGEKLAGAGALVCVLASLIPSSLMSVRPEPALFQVSMTITQNLGCYFVLGALLSLFLFDQIDWHYRRSVRDELTGLYNRRYFNEQLDRLLVRGSGTGCLALFDIDHFKKVNDTFGHDAGDLAVQRVAREIQESLPPGALVARYGGEEFVCFLPESDEPLARHFLELIRQKVSDLAVETPRGSVAVTTSIGLCLVLPGTPVAQAFKCADDALYQAKRAGRNTLVSSVTVSR